MPTKQSLPSDVPVSPMANAVKIGEVALDPNGTIDFNLIHVRDQDGSEIELKRTQVKISGEAYDSFKRQFWEEFSTRLLKHAETNGVF